MDWTPEAVNDGFVHVDNEGNDLSDSSPVQQQNYFNENLATGASTTTKKVISPEDKERANKAKDLGNDAFRNGRHSDAIRFYDEAIISDPTEPSYYTNRAAANMSLHKFSLALEDCNKSSAIQGSDVNVKTLTRLARCHFQLGNLEAARSTIDRALIIDSNDSSAISLQSQIIRTQNHIQSYKRDLEKKSYQMASIALDAASKEVSDIPLSWRLMRAELMLLRNQLDIANSVVSDALRIYQNDPDALVLRGRILLALGSDLSKATQHAQAALRADPEHKTAINLLRKCRKLETAKENANSAFKSGNTEEAIQLYTEAINLAGDEAKGFKSLLYTNRATANAKLNKQKEAINDCTESLRFNETFGKAFRIRARAYLAEEKYEEAVSDFKNAIDHSSPNEINSLKRELQSAEIDLKRSKKKDYYKILGVSKTASSVEIKKAYRNQSLLHHPDKGGDEEKFKLCSEAFSILSDDQKRRRYDMGIDDNDPTAGFGGGFGGAGGAGGFGQGVNLADLFAQAGMQNGHGMGGPSPFSSFAGAGGAGRRSRPPPGFQF